MEGTGEPAYTNSTSNTQWISWQAPAAADAYRLHARYYRDNVQVSEVTWSVPMSGTSWLNWSAHQLVGRGHGEGRVPEGRREVARARGSGRPEVLQDARRGRMHMA